MADRKVLILTNEKLSDFAEAILSFFDTTVTYSLFELSAAVEKDTFKVLVLDSVSVQPVDKEGIREVIELSDEAGIPLVVLSRSNSVQDKLDAIELGCDDFIDPAVGADELRARITKSIFNRIATDQLANRLELASKTAQSALIDNSELGLNIQFLLDVHKCENLDQLGQLFFTTIERYSLTCSLQLRSEMEVKNMEAHGMAKDLESQLLSHMKDGDRYIDFGKRTIMNYGRVSLLVKNMPVDNPERYGSIKDNTFSLIQGMNARVIALEDKYNLLDERESLKSLTQEVSSVMTNLKDAYQGVMRNIANEVDTANERILSKIPDLSLTEASEQFLESTLHDCVKNTAATFNEGLLLDDVMNGLDRTMQKCLNKLELSDASRNDRESHSDTQTNHIELF